MPYRCYRICGRSLKAIALPVILIITETGAYYAKFDDLSKFLFASGEISGGNVVPKGTLISNAISVVCEIAGNFLLTSTIATKIWLTMRNLEVASGRYYRPYSHVITIMVESGFIMLLFYTTFAGLLLNNGTGRYTPGLSVMGAIIPQITTLVPLLIVVRIGLGQAFEKEHVRIATLNNSTLNSEGRARAPHVSDHSSTFRVTEQDDQDSVMNIHLRGLRPSDDESARGYKLEGV